MMTLKTTLSIAVITLSLTACSDSSNGVEVGDGVGVGNTDQPIDGNTESILNTSLFRSLVSATTTNCTLSDGTSTTCHELTFNVNELRDGSGSGELIDDEAGPFCPSAYTSNDGGVGIYDGNTNPGFQNLTQVLWDNMQIDGFDLIDEEAGIVCVQDPGSRESVGNNCTSACLNASADDALTVTYLIPITPVMLSQPANIGSVQPVGVSLDGVPITGEPPSVVSGPMGIAGAGGSIPSLDYCGGHHDPAGYYHWHLVPESADAVHAVYGTDALANCGSTITQDSTALTGFAKDGYPIYAYQDMVSGSATTPSDLDACNGHTGATSEYPDGVYHYHASLDAPSVPTCTIGASVDARLSPAIR